MLRNPNKTFAAAANLAKQPQSVFSDGLGCPTAAPASNQKGKSMNAQDVLDFWFAESNRPFWFAKNDDFDQQIRSRFFPLWQQAAAGELADWRDTLRGRLAEIIILD